MKYEEAKHILLLNDDFNDKELKKQYRILALKYHPDKNNNSEESKILFQQVNDAYTSLNKNNNGSTIQNSSYKEILVEYLKNQFEIEDKFMISFILNLLDNCQKISLNLLEKLPNSEYLHYIFLFIKQNKDVLHLDDKFMEELDNIYNKVQNKRQIVNIFPDLQDLVEQNIIKLIHNEQVYYVPSWSKEIIFDLDKDEGTELVVNVFPKLPTNINLDSQNNLIVHISQPISSLLDKEYLPVQINKNTINIPVKDIKIIKKQRFFYKKQGIPRIDENNSYNNEILSDLCIYINLF